MVACLRARGYRESADCLEKFLPLGKGFGPAENILSQGFRPDASSQASGCLDGGFARFRLPVDGFLMCDT